MQEQHYGWHLLQALITSGALSFADLQEVLLLYGQLADGDADHDRSAHALDVTAAGVERRLMNTALMISNCNPFSSRVGV